MQALPGVDISTGWDLKDFAKKEEPKEEKKSGEKKAEEKKD